MHIFRGHYNKSSYSINNQTLASSDTICRAFHCCPECPTTKNMHGRDPGLTVVAMSDRHLLSAPIFFHAAPLPREQPPHLLDCYPHASRRPRNPSLPRASLSHPYTPMQGRTPVTVAMLMRVQLAMWPGLGPSAGRPPCTADDEIDHLLLCAPATRPAAVVR